MKNLYFSLSYHTLWGERPEVVASVDGADAVCVPLLSDDGEQWHASLSVADDVRTVRHAYRIVNNAGDTLRVEPNAWRYFELNHRTNVSFDDAWTEDALPEYLQHTSFSRCAFLPRGGEALHIETLSSPCLLLLHALPPGEGKCWMAVGSTPRWGEWDVRRARRLQRTGTYEWGLTLSREDFTDGVEYKYVLADRDRPDTAVWEDGGNRVLTPLTDVANRSLIRQDERPRIALTPWKAAGVVVPVFSLRSEGSFGIGDFGDLSTLIRWAAETGLRAVQLLPINDTTRAHSWHDSYPYNSVSVFALHPIYLDAREWRTSEAYLKYKDEARAINALPQLDYEAAERLKRAFAADLYREIGRAVTASAEFKNFTAENDYWLTPYARFCVRRDVWGTANFRSWPEESEAQTEAFDLAHHDEWQQCRFVQYLLHRQMARAHAEARERGVVLKGDIPIGISPDSVPAWRDGRLFHFTGQAGAPPDDFAKNGQNWGFPTYNWDEMARDGYSWWCRRLAHMECYFDAYRIDHVLGFFRIWEIPSEHFYGLLGRFRPALPYTLDEIRGFGLMADVERLTVPIVSAGRYAELAANIDLAPYFAPCPEGYVVKEEYRSQRYAAAHIANDEARNVVLDTIAEVLFIRDDQHTERFHPRVMGMQSHRFDMLTAEQRNAFCRLHDDYYYFRHNEYWAREAMKKLPAVTRSADRLSPSIRLYAPEGRGMLPCAEDLGMIPASVKGVLERLDILSLEIQRMPKEYGVRFGRTENYPYLSVATIATHDMPPFRLWWRESEEQRTAFWHEVLHRSGTAPDEAAPEVCEQVVRLHLHAPSMLCLLALQDWLAISPNLRSNHPEEEQINVPAESDWYWRYRMHLTLEDLVRATDFAEKVRALVAAE